MKRAFTNILTDDVDGTASFYESLLGLRRSGDFGWFVLLAHPDMPAFELGVLDNSHETIPSGHDALPGGTMLTFVVDAVEAIHKTASELGVEIVQAPTDLSYGQRRVLLRDPNGTLVDVSAPIR
ncbi:catechol 2,3-dioxygenase-like lactoylglutathione lyase family enzyme [Rubricella aquisinus]|uniref:Catechol 2,3-dioxygenase-like lactoylglutathione lyase family enzyme n=1 Tax=Rubricella aquisinus TaxID=2028108 RepID=A0A840WQV7_9RHOB|nr:VOC family protein [Rubricella aquisinus]MBB5516062.1 catechol 2,3-dioxygenase-like lactoylglutathione lyase family enzyme [Rubricella aquisinus]